MLLLQLKPLQPTLLQLQLTPLHLPMRPLLLVHLQKLRKKLRSNIRAF
jgi:hypothetical protein